MESRTPCKSFDFLSSLDNPICLKNKSILVETVCSVRNLSAIIEFIKSPSFHWYLWILVDSIIPKNRTFLYIYKQIHIDFSRCIGVSQGGKVELSTNNYNRSIFFLFFTIFIAFLVSKIANALSAIIL